MKSSTSRTSTAGSNPSACSLRRWAERSRRSEALVMTAVDMQQHAGQGPPWAPLAMHPPLPLPRHQPRALQGRLHPAVTQLDRVLFTQLLVKMTHVEIEILLPVQSQNLFHRRQRNPLGAGLSPPPVEQPVIAKFLVALAPAPHVPVADADNLRCLPPGDLLGHRSQNHFLYFHRPLHGGLRVRVHASHGLLLSPPAKRTFHVLIRPDISCVNDTYFYAVAAATPMCYLAGYNVEGNPLLRFA